MTDSGSASPGLHACILVGTLKPSPAQSSSMLMAQQFADAFTGHGVDTDVVRVVDFDVRPGVDVDMGSGDEWPGLRERIMAADILGIVSPTWMGHPSSVTQRVLERLDGELSQTNEQGTPLIANRAAVVGVVGNEDGAHKIIADVLQALNDVGLAVPSQASTYWNGEAMHKVDYKDLPEPPKATVSALTTAAANAVALATALRPSRVG
ncbi:flavodoxin family protein [Humibacter albus]|jgi:multimeric flavodoxin WrbA|uniref:flavodoxin family protein n=1 Tax=Humibacter albus TaxID=427754 RepID=UPI0003B66BEE|nr:NAD(P)H-dependent oxidoreductase [Humibacter albus]